MTAAKPLKHAHIHRHTFDYSADNNAEEVRNTKKKKKKTGGKT